MSRYVIGAEIDGITTCNIEDEELKDIKDSTIFIILDKESNSKLYAYYSMLKVLILNRNKIILIMVGSESKIRKQLSMLMVSYQQYDIYSIDNIDTLSKEYADALEERNATEEEVRTFIGSDIASYKDLNELLLEIKEAVENSDISRINQIITEKKDIIDSSVDVIDYMKSAIDNMNTGETDKKLNELRAEIAELKRGMDESERKLKEANLSLDQANDSNKTLTKESFLAKTRAKELEDSLNNRGPVIKTYTTVLTSTIKCKARSIIYFKEVSYVRYTNTLVIKLTDIISKLHKLKVKLLIYDNKNSFTAIYKPISVIGSAEYMANAHAYANTHDKLVIVECNQAIIEDMLKADYDVVIIYDRLKQATDIVSGNNVYKYWVINSKQEFNALYPVFKMERQYTITQPGVFPECIAISDIPGYSAQTNSGGTAQYMKLLLENKKKIIETICDRTNIVSIPSRG